MHASGKGFSAYTKTSSARDASCTHIRSRQTREPWTIECHVTAPAEGVEVPGTAVLVTSVAR